MLDCVITTWIFHIECIYSDQTHYPSVLTYPVLWAAVGILCEPHTGYVHLGLHHCLVCRYAVITRAGSTMCVRDAFLKITWMFFDWRMGDGRPHLFNHYVLNLLYEVKWGKISWNERNIERNTILNTVLSETLKTWHLTRGWSCGSLSNWERRVDILVCCCHGNYKAAEVGSLEAAAFLFPELFSTIAHCLHIY